MEWADPHGAPTKPVHDAQRNFVRVAVPAGLKVPLTAAGLLAALPDLPLFTDAVAGQVPAATAPSGQAVLVPAAQLLRDDVGQICRRRSVTCRAGSTARCRCGPATTR